MFILLVIERQVQILFYTQVIGKNLRVWHSQVLEMIRINIISMLLVGVCIGAISLEDSFTLFSEAEQHEPSTPAILLLGTYPRETYILITGDMYLKKV